jgi:hypothetical protein
MNTIRKAAFSTAVLFILLAACDSHLSLKPGTPLPLAISTENGVTVKISLVQDSTGQVFLAATFTPLQPGYHLYSKDLALAGEGRPTLLELPPDSRIKSVGDVIESESSEVSSMGSDALLVYPAGPVTLSLPIKLPQGRGWVQEQVSITYEACSDMTCLPPVMGKLIPTHIPEADLVVN